MQFNLINTVILLATGSQVVLAGSIPEKTYCDKLPTGPSERCTARFTDEGKKVIMPTIKTALAMEMCPGYTGKAKFDEATELITTDYPKGGAKILFSMPDSLRYYVLTDC